jgi:hypothetical protein
MKGFIEFLEQNGIMSGETSWQMEFHLPDFDTSENPRVLCWRFAYVEKVSEEGRVSLSPKFGWIGLNLELPDGHTQGSGWKYRYLDYDGASGRYTLSDIQNSNTGAWAFEGGQIITYA